MSEAALGAGTEDQVARRRQRWPAVGACTLVVLAVFAAAWWFLWVPSWRPPLREGEEYGIDVSSHQESIEWRRVAADDIAFAYIKATEGGDFVDDRFNEHWRSAGEADLERGAYHFFTLCAPGAVQARHFLSVAPPDPAALAPAVDLELAGNCKERPAERAVAEELEEFLAIVEDAWGRPVVLYVGNDFEDRYPARERLARPLWHRRFLLRPDVDRWVVWQLHGYAKVAGVSGGVDLNVMRSG